jgi:hypothetical protein
VQRQRRKVLKERVLVCMRPIGVYGHSVSMGSRSRLGRLVSWILRFSYSKRMVPVCQQIWVGMTGSTLFSLCIQRMLPHILEIRGS